MTKKIQQSILKKYYPELIIFLLAIVLRYLGIFPGYPAMHPDEPTSYSTAIYMLGHSYKPDRFDYAAGMAFINAIVYKTIFLPIQLFRLFITQPGMIFSYLKLDERSIDRSYEFLFGNRWIYAMYWSRFIHATIGILTVILLYFTVKKIFNRPTAILAAGFLAVNYRHVLGGHFGLPDVINSFFALFALFAAAMLMEKRTLRRYIFVGIAAGLSFSIKYQFFAFFPLLFAHLYCVVKSRKISFLFHPYAWCALLAAVLTFLAINPYYPFNFREAMRRNDQDFRRYQMGVMYFRPYGFFYLFHWGIGELASIAVVIGAVIMFFKKLTKFLLIGLFPVIFLAFMTYFSNGGIYPRNFVTPMPYLMIFAGFAVYAIYDWMKRFRFRHAALIIGLVMIGVNIKPAYNSFVLSINYQKPWNIKIFQQWLVDTLPANIKLRAYQLFLDDLGNNALKKKHVKFLSWDYSKGENSLAEFQEEGTDFAIIQLYSFQNITYWWRSFPKKSMFFQNDIPYDYIMNSFYGLTLREFLPYTVAEIYKPWQALEEINYLMFKIPKRPQAIGKPLFQFNQEAINAWEPIDPFGLGSGNGTFRVSSAPFAVIPGKQYLISGLMKEDGDKEATYDGYLRMDFYENREDFQKETMSLGVALSSRVIPNGQWEKKEFAATAPMGTHFATVSYQRFSPYLAYPLQVSNVEVFETEPSKEELFPEVPYIQSTIQYKDIFYASFL